MPRPTLGRRRLWDETDDEDPLAGMANLFDVALVFMIALAVALVARLATDTSELGSSAQAEMRAAEKLDRYRVSKERLRGRGTRLGTAYRLPNGDVVYVPD